LKKNEPIFENVEEDLSQKAMRDEQERLTKDRKDRERLQQVKLLRENEQLDNIRLEAEQVERTKKEREAANSLEQDEIQTKKPQKKPTNDPLFDLDDDDEGNSVWKKTRNGT